MKDWVYSTLLAAPGLSSVPQVDPMRKLSFDTGGLDTLCQVSLFTLVFIILVQAKKPQSNSPSSPDAEMHPIQRYSLLGAGVAAQQ